LGSSAGASSQNLNAVAIGFHAGQTNQATNSIAIGSSAGEKNQGYGMILGNSIAIGTNAGQTNQGIYSIAIGTNAGQTNQGATSCAFGSDSGRLNQGINCVAIGNFAGQNWQGISAIAIGFSAGMYTQGDNAIAIGNLAGQNTQGDNAIAIGNFAGLNTQGQNAIAIGNLAGSDKQGANSLCIGYNTNSTNSNSIVLYGGGTGLNGVTSGFYAEPIRSAGSTGTSLLGYIGNEIVVAPKTFVIPHPKNDAKYLVHACLEGPEGGVYYRGESAILNSHSVLIDLPDYVDSIATDFTVQVTPIYSHNALLSRPLFTTRVKNNSFQVFGDNCEFFWTVIGKRVSIVVEPNIDEVHIKGSGPYRWLS
jgi:hypothetical protein